MRIFIALILYLNAFILSFLLLYYLVNEENKI